MTVRVCHCDCLP